MSGSRLRPSARPQAAQNNHQGFLLTADRRLVTAFGQMFERLWEELGK